MEETEDERLSSRTSYPFQEFNAKKTSRYRICSSVSEGLVALISTGGFSGRIVSRRGEESVMIAEYESDENLKLPEFIASLETYTERECRCIFRRVLQCILTLHQQRVAHRTLTILSIRVALDALSSDSVCFIVVSSKVIKLNVSSFFLLFHPFSQNL